ncbi:MAG: hypothetical protein AAF458_00360 [Pseudomonadota bacterium]
MGTFFSVVAGVVVGGIILIALGWIWLKRKFSKLGDALQEIAAALSGENVPPFRITVTSAEADAAWRDEQGMLGRTQELDELGYEHAGDFRIAEIEGVLLRAACHRSDACMAVVFEHPQAESLLVDIVRSHGDHLSVLATNAPDQGMHQPPTKTTVRLAADATIADLHQAAMQASRGHEAVAVTPRLFPMLYAAAYAAEMDWRIECGGVTADEVRAAAAAGGQDEPDEAAIEIVQSQWRIAIQSFVDNEAIDQFAASGQLSQVELEDKRERIKAVHDRTDRSGLIELIVEAAVTAREAEWDEEADDYDERYDAAHEAATNAVEAAFRNTEANDLRSATEAAIAAAEAPVRHLGSVEKPRHADLYLFPELT